ncbi:MAG: type IV toxin-antitoxin system AbiEi family antitoxin domain-containing protein [Piscinibacter sp.]|uniref:type IV toxin-antitoxin system AbiEi family antitoxin domain-containing protein n=1 Tax=Piscinibacter sp. TaxID=1903157 RepID=UPI003D0E3E80
MNGQLLPSTPEWYKPSDDCFVRPRIHTMPAAYASTQRTKALVLLRRRGMTRLAEFNAAGITATTISRMERAGEVVRLARGLYQLPDAELDAQQSLAEAARLVPKGVICLASALAFHGLTDQMPPKVWIAIGRKDWRPRVTYPPIRIARFSDELLRRGVEHKKIAGTSVPVFGVAKTVADLFRYRRTVGDALAIEGLRQALRQRKATPAEITREAKAIGVWATMEPYVMALTSDA